MRIDCIVGARPNFIKIAPLLAEMNRREMSYRLIHTGQHYDYEMNGNFFDELEIPVPNVNLGIGSGTHAQQTATAMIKLEEEFLKNETNLVVVVGDVNSTLAGALVAAKMNISVVHVEAGYRSFDRNMPEEINRIIVDHLAKFLFAPTEDAVNNLIQEGVNRNKVHFVGNIMAETLIKNLHAVRTRKKNKELGLKDKTYAVATIHRPENVDDANRLQEIWNAFSESPLPVVLPLHPRTKKQVQNLQLSNLNHSLIIAKPLSYLDLLSLVSDACMVLTDSGGLQEESCLLNVPCLTIRKNTERTATIAVGANRLICAEKNSILSSIDELIVNGNKPWEKPPKWDNLVAKRIVEIIALDAKKT